MSTAATHAQLLDAADLAERWKVPKSHVWRLSRESKIPTVRLGPKYVRFRLAAVEEFEASGGCSK